MRWFALILVGVAWWTLLEYLLHRFAFHRAGRFVGRRHLAHHARLTERRLAIAPWQSMLLGLSIHAIVLKLLFGIDGLVVFGGVMIGYAVYEWVHYGTHYRVARTRAGRYLRAYHLAHHHQSAKVRFGVTSPIWDRVFGTYQTVPTGKR